MRKTEKMNKNETIHECYLRWKEQYDEITHLKSIIKEVREYIIYQLDNMDFEKDTKAKMFGAMILVLLDKENK